MTWSVVIVNVMNGQGMDGADDEYLFPIISISSATFSFMPLKVSPKYNKVINAHFLQSGRGNKTKHKKKHCKINFTCQSCTSISKEQNVIC